MTAPAPAEPATPFGQSAEGIDRAEGLAASAVAHFVTSVALANLDTTIATTFLVAELLASLKVHSNVEPEALIAQFRHLINQRAAELEGVACSECGGMLDKEVQNLSENTPATVH